MNYSKLTDSHLSEKVFYGSNPNTKRIHFKHGVCGFVETQTKEMDDVDYFSILDFGDLMPLAVANDIYYVFYRGNDYQQDRYKAVHVNVDGGCNYTTIDSSVERAIAICLIKKIEGDANEKI